MVCYQYGYQKTGFLKIVEILQYGLYFKVGKSSIVFRFKLQFCYFSYEISALCYQYKAFSSVWFNQFIVFRIIYWKKWILSVLLRQQRISLYIIFKTMYSIPSAFLNIQEYLVAYLIIQKLLGNYQSFRFHIHITYF